MDQTKFRALCGAMMIAAASPSYADICDTTFVERTAITPTDQTLTLCKGFATVINTQTAFETVILGNEGIVSLSVINPNVLSIIGMETGKTNIHLFDTAGDIISQTIIDVVAPTMSGPTPTPQVDISKQTTTPRHNTTEQQKPVRIVVTAGSAEILYECAENCTKLDR